MSAPSAATFRRACAQCLQSSATSLRANWRWGLYVAFLALRIVRWVLDRSFPTDDGSFYYVKAAWMAAEPLRRSMPWEAFGFLPHRPPGPMWLSLPFMAAHVSFLSFAVAMMVWVVVATELAARGLFAQERAQARNVCASALIFGNVAFFAGFETFYVDHIHTAFTACAVGLGVGWLREKRFSFALGCGLAAAMTLWIKPAGLALIVSVAGALGAVLLLEAILGGERGVRAFLRQRLLQGFVLLVFPALAMFSLFFSAYSAAWQDYHPDHQRHWQQQYLAPWYAVDGGKTSLDSAAQVFRNVMEIAGPPLFLLLLAGSGAALGGYLSKGFRTDKRNRAFLLSALFLFIVTLGIFLFSWRLPVKANRYVSPLAALLIAGGCFLLFGPWRFRRGLLWATFLCAVVWRVLFVAGVVPDRAWLRSPRTFAFPMARARANIEAIDASCKKMADRDSFSFVAVNPSVEFGGLYLIRLARWAGVESCVEELGLDAKVMTYCPSWPEFVLDDLPQFFSADFLFAHAPRPKEFFPEGSRRADLTVLEAALYDPQVAAEAGWELLRETPETRLYLSGVSAGSVSQAEALRRRARFFGRVEFESPDGRDFGGSLLTLSRVERLDPAGRKIEVSPLGKGFRGLLFHAPYPGNPLPESLELRLHASDTLMLQMRESDDGDGMTVAMDRKRGTEWEEAHSWHLPLKASREIDPWQWLEHKEAASVRFRFLPGPNGDARNDCLCFGVTNANAQP